MQRGNERIRIKVVLPVATDMWNNATLKECQKYKCETTDIDVINIKNGPDSIECLYDMTFSSFFTIQELEKAEKEGYDGAITCCFGDVALDAAKEKLEIPVVGLQEASVHIAAMLGGRFSILAVGPGATALASIEKNLGAYGMSTKCASIRFLDIPVLNLDAKRKELEERALEEGRRAIDHDNAHAIVLGCGVLSLFGIDEVLKTELGVPIIVPVGAAIKVCESLIYMGVAQSKAYFKKPPKKDRG